MGKRIIGLGLFVGIACVSAEPALCARRRPVAGPMYTDSAGKAGGIAARSVLRVYCTDSTTVGSGFVHRSGRVITTDHVVRGCAKSSLRLLHLGREIRVKGVVSDPDRDLALLLPSEKLRVRALKIRKKSAMPIGAQVSAWGFPVGYQAEFPMLSVGYLSGMESFQRADGTLSTRWVVNAAFNSGNSGGPLVNVEDGKVIGVVVSKLAPMPLVIRNALKYLEEEEKGIQITHKARDGSHERLSQSQLLALILDYLKSQVQLVVGYSVRLGDLKDFLLENGLKP